MQSFEKYHPIMSVHYTMDWLTTFKIKDIFQLRADRQVAAESGREFDQKITDTARYINRSMRLVMSNNALLYGIMGFSRQPRIPRQFLYLEFQPKENRGASTL